MERSRHERLKLIREIMLPSDHTKGLSIELLGVGTSGAVFKVNADPKTCVAAIGEHLYNAHPSSRCIVSASTSVQQEETLTHTECAVKVQLLDDGYEAGCAMHEAGMHKAMRCDPLIGKHVPALYAAWLLHPHAEASAGCNIGFSVTAMEYLRGYSTAWACVSKKVFSEFRQRETVYKNVRCMVLSMWSQGFMHGDLHSRNIMVHPETMCVKVIDFGFSEIMSTSTRSACRRAWMALERKQWFMATVFYHRCAMRVKEDIAVRLANLAYHHPDPYMLVSMRLWVDDPSSSLTTDEIVHADRVENVCEGAENRRRRDESTKDIFYDMRPRFISWASSLRSRTHDALFAALSKARKSWCALHRMRFTR